MRSLFTLPWLLAGCFLLAGIWHFASATPTAMRIASPLETGSAAVALLSQQNFWQEHVLPTVWRVLSGVFMGGAAGGILGCLAGVYPGAALFLLPFRWVLASVPGVVLVTLAVFCCGHGSGMITSIVALTAAPTFYIALREGTAAIDGNLVEMAKAYRIPLHKRIWGMYLPAVRPHAVAAGILALSGGVRVAILGEALGTAQGLGQALFLARAGEDAAQLCAVALISMLLSGVLEASLLRSLRKRQRVAAGV